MNGRRGSAAVRVAILAVVILTFIGLGVLWKLQGSADDGGLSASLAEIRATAGELSPWVATGYVVIACVVAVPLGVIIPVVAFAFGPWLGITYIMLGGTLGAALSYMLGSYLGHDGLRLFGGERINRVSVRLAERGIIAVVVIRMLPVAPFAIVNMIAGASHIRALDFLIGTILGLFPGTVLIAFSIGQIERWLGA